MKTTITPEDNRDRKAMLNLYRERGPQTEAQLLAAGISKESQTRNVGWVAEQVKLLEAA